MASFFIPRGIVIGLSVSCRCLPKFVLSVFSRSSVYSCFEQFLWGGLSGSGGGLSFGHPFGYFSFLSAFIHFGCQSFVDGGEFFKTKICLRHLNHGFSSLLLYSIAFSASWCFSTFRPSSSIRNSVSTLSIHSAFLLWCFRSHILPTNIFASFASGALFVKKRMILALNNPVRVDTQ